MEDEVKRCKEGFLEYMKTRPWVVADAAREEAKVQGFNKTVFKLARKELGVKTFHQFDEDGATPNWFWSLK